jgi:hypothetical protein
MADKTGRLKELNYFRGLLRLWLVCWVLVTGYYIWSGLGAEFDSYQSCVTRNGPSGCIENYSAFLALPIIYSITAFIFVPIIFIVARATARWVWRGFV